MSEPIYRPEEPPSSLQKADSSKFFGWFEEFFGQFRLAWRLLLDGRVSVLPKIIPLLTTLYILSPIDLVPDLALGFGQLDDLAVFLIGLRLFIDMCPPELVAELKGGAPITPVMDTPLTGDVIDVEVRMPETRSNAEADDETTR